MPLTETEKQDINLLLRRIEALEKDLESFKKHKHIGTDGSEQFSDETVINAKKIIIHGSGKATRKAQVIENLFEMLESSETAKSSKGAFMANARALGLATGLVGEKDEATEQMFSILSVGKRISSNDVDSLNRIDFEKLNSAQLNLQHVPKSAGGASGPSSFPPFSFLYANRTPQITGSQGDIVLGDNTLTDLSANFITNQLVGSFITLLSTSETRKITANTATQITIEGTWEAATGNYTYQVVTPVFLGQALLPFTRLYVGEDIRLGYGASGGIQVRYIKWGTGTPEGVVTANIGSLFLRTDGGGSTTLYIKESGNGTNTGWMAK